MPLYEYRCPSHGPILLPTRADRIACPYGNHHHDATRRFSFAITSTMPEHYNTSVGQYVSNSRQFSDALKRKSEEATIRTGIPHDYQPIDYHDADAHGVTEEGMDATRRAEYARRNA